MAIELQILHTFDDKDYNPEWQRFSREAVRAVILQNNKIALVQSKTDGFYKFPGGGINKGENHIETLVRETHEETGLTIIPQSITELGMIQELRKGIHGDEIFDQKSYYYYADVSSIITSQDLDDYEKDLGFELVWMDIETAYNTNVELGKNQAMSFLIREAYVLNYIKNGGYYANTDL